MQSIGLVGDQAGKETGFKRHLLAQPVKQVPEKVSQGIRRELVFAPAPCRQRVGHFFGDEDILASFFKHLRAQLPRKHLAATFGAHVYLFNKLEIIGDQCTGPGQHAGFDGIGQGIGDAFQCHAQTTLAGMAFLQIGIGPVRRTCIHAVSSIQRTHRHHAESVRCAVIFADGHILSGPETLVLEMQGAFIVAIAVGVVVDIPFAAL